MQYVYLLLLVGGVIAACVLANRITNKLKVPSLLLFIGLGMLFGVLTRLAGRENFTDYALGNVVCSVCLVFVIFSGGFGTNFKEARPVAGRAVLLSFVGTALTAALVGVGVYGIFRLLPFFGEVGWLESFLVGSVVASTDAASVFNILRSRRLNLKYRTSSLLEMESGSNDPTSYMLTVVFTALLAAKYAAEGARALGAWQIVGMLSAQICFGVLFGAAFGIFGAFLLKRVNFNMGQGGTIFVVALALLAYSVPSALPGVWQGNGYLSVYVCGILLGNARISQKRDCVRFFDALTGVAQMMIFFLLGFLSTPEWLIRPQVLVPALLIFLFMTLIARPIAVGTLLAPFRAPLGQIGVVSWAGLRGVASVVFAIYAVSTLGEALPYDLFSIVFCIVLISVAVQGTLLPFVSAKMRMLGDTEDVLRTFNDYQEETDVSFVKVVVGEEHPWAGRPLRQCVMPHGFLVVLIRRGDETIVPSGGTVVYAGDVLVTAAPAFENREEFGMFEEYVGKNHEWADKRLREIRLPEGSLVAMIKRKGGTVIPYGASKVREGDTLVCIRIPPTEAEKSLPPKSAPPPSAPVGQGEPPQIFDSAPKNGSSALPETPESETESRA